MDDDRISITVCGDGGCGKSSITLRLVRSQWTHEYAPPVPPTAKFPPLISKSKCTDYSLCLLQLRSHNRYFHLHLPLKFTLSNLPIQIQNAPPSPPTNINITLTLDTSPSPTPPEDSYSVTRTIDGHAYYLDLTDTAGQEEYRGLWAASNLRSDAFLLVYDITSSASLANLSYFADLIGMEEETRQDAGGLQPIKIVVGNKCDLKELREVPARQGLEWARSRGAGFMETSARECVNIEETFALIVRRVSAARKAHVHAAAATLHTTTSRGESRQPKSPSSPSSTFTFPPVSSVSLFPTSKSKFKSAKSSKALHSPQQEQYPSSSMLAVDHQYTKEADNDRDVTFATNADISEFAERPGARRVKRGGWRARWAAWCRGGCCC